MGLLVSRRVYSTMTSFAPLAQDDADGRLVVGMAQLIVDGGQIEVHLAGKFRLEVLDLQLDDDEAPEPQVIEQQVEIIVLAADVEVILAADEGEALAELEDEGAQMLNEAPFQITLEHIGAEGEKIEAV